MGTGGPHPFSGTPAEIENLVRQVRDARKRLGPDGAVMFDAHCSVPPPMLIQFAAAIEPQDVLFIEEPAVPGNIEVFKRLKEAIRVPLATGERESYHLGHDPLSARTLHRHLAARLWTHGRHYANEKDRHAGRGVHRAAGSALHHVGTRLSASLHASACVPHLLIHEGYLDGHAMAAGVARKNWDVGADGYASLPQGPAWASRWTKKRWLR